MMKGGNRRFFESLLVRNVLAALGGGGEFRVQKGQGRILLFSEKRTDEAAARDALSKTFGVDSLSFPIQSKAEIKEIESAVLTGSERLSGKSIKVDTKRSDKGFPLTSPQVNAIVGRALVGAGCSVDLDNPDVTVSIEILRGKALIFTERFKGPSGLPISSSGKVLSLLSGGIDSPVSSWMMMKRGCVVDFLHLHTLPTNREVMDSKMIRILRTLRSYEASILSSSVVIFTALFSLMFLGEKISLNQWLGILTMIIGFSLVQVRKGRLDAIYRRIFRKPQPIESSNKKEAVH